MAQLTVKKNKMGKIVAAPKVLSSKAEELLRTMVTSSEPTVAPAARPMITSLPKPPVADHLTRTLGGVAAQLPTVRVQSIPRQRHAFNRNSDAQPRLADDTMELAKLLCKMVRDMNTPTLLPPGCKNEPGHCSAARDAQLAWEKLSANLCPCRKERIKAALRKHNDLQEKRTLFLISMMNAYNTYADGIGEYVEKYNVHVSWDVERDEDGKEHLKHQLHILKEGEYGTVSEEQLQKLATFYEEFVQSPYLPSAK